MESYCLKCKKYTKNMDPQVSSTSNGKLMILSKCAICNCFQHDMAYGNSKDLAKRTIADKVLRDKAFKIASDQKYDGCQRGLASMVRKFFDKKSSGSGTINNKQNIQLANELHKLIIRKFKKRKVFLSFRDNIWGADLADMQLLITFNKGYRFLLCFIDIYSKYMWVIPIKDKKKRKYC